MIQTFSEIIKHLSRVGNIGLLTRNQDGVVIRICLLVLRMLSLPLLIYHYVVLLFSVYAVNIIISSVILDLWKLWPLLFLGKHGVVCGI